MTEADKDIVAREQQIEPWSPSKDKRDLLEQHASGQRHTIIEDPGPFRKLALSGDGNTLVAAARQVLCLFNTKTREPFDRFVFDCDIEQVAINGNGEAVFIADAMQAIHLIDLPFSYRDKVAQHGAEITAMSVDNAGSKLAIADISNGITLLDTSDFKSSSSRDCEFVVQRIVIRHDEDLLLGFGEREAVVYRLSTAECLARYGNDHHVAESFGLTDEYLVTEAPGGFVIFDTVTHEFRFVATPAYRAYDTTPDGSVLVTARNHQFVQWDVSRGIATRQVGTYIRDVGDVKICDEGQSVYVCGDGATIESYSVGGERVATFSDFLMPIMAAMTTHDDRTLVVADEAGSVAVYDLVTGKANRYHLHTCCISKLHVEGSLMATGAHDGWARVLNLESGSEVFSVCFPGIPVQAITLDGDRFVITGNRLGQVRLYDLDDHRLVRQFHGNDCTVRSLALSPCRRYLMSTNDSGEALVFDYKSGELVNQLQGTGTSYSGCFDESGEFLYFGDGLGRIVKSRPEAKRISRRWTVHRNDVRSIRVQQGKLVSIGISADARIIDCKSGKTLLQCPIDTRPYRRVAFTTAAGTRLVTGGQDGCLMFRDSADGSILAELRNLAHGFLWVSHADKDSDNYTDCFWTDREEMIQVYNRTGGIETLLLPSSKEYKDYINIHNNQAMTMARVGMTPAASKQHIEEQRSTHRESLLDWDNLALLEQFSG